MKNIPFGMAATALTVALLAAPAAAFAQSQEPTREGNVWGWRDHQPTEAQVLKNEAAASVQLTPTQRHAAASAVDQLLMRRARLQLCSAHLPCLPVELEFCHTATTSGRPSSAQERKT